MKKQFFTFLMMIALVIVAGKAMAAVGDKFNPYPGGTYTYNLPYTLAHAGNVTMTITGGELTVGTTTPNGLTAAGATIALASGASSLVIPITFDDNATGTKVLSIVITDLTSTCNNNIFINIPMAPKPALDLALTASTLTCQALVASPESGVAASVPTVTETLVNTITFTVTPAVTGISDYSYGYTLTIPTDGQTGLNSYTIAYSGPGSAVEGTGSFVVSGITEADNAPGIFTISFVTTTGIAPETITGTLSASTLTDVVNSGTYAATFTTSPASSVVNSVPAIGSFN